MLTIRPVSLHKGGYDRLAKQPDRGCQTVSNKTRGIVMQFKEFVEDRVFSPTLVADALHTTQAEIAGTLGLGRDAFSSVSQIRAQKTQTRLRQMLEILHRVEAQTGSELAAYAWFRAEPLPGFGGLTPNQLLRQGRADQVHAHLDRIVAGGYA